MVSCKAIEDCKYWNNKISEFKNFSAYQIYQWGEYKKHHGWSILRLEFTGETSSCFIQITYKKRLNVFLGWTIGSIAGDVSVFSKDLLIDFVNRNLNCRYVVLKSSFINPLCHHESFNLYSSGWNKSGKKLNADYSMEIKLSNGTKDLKFSSNWKRNLKRGIKKNENIQIQFLKNCNYKEIYSLFLDFKKIKNISIPSEHDIKAIKEELGSDIYIAKSLINGKLVGFRACLIYDSKAIDFWAATIDVGRKNYSSHVLLYTLLEKCADIGIETYDMSGIDPVNNKSVFSFKNGLRGMTFEKLGEWELTNSNLLLFILNKVIFK